MKPSPSERHQKGERKKVRRSQSIDNSPRLTRPKMPTDRNTRASMTNIDPSVDPIDIKSRFKSSTRIKVGKSKKRASMDNTAPEPPQLQTFPTQSPPPPPPPSSSPFIGDESPMGGSITFTPSGGASASFAPREKRASPWILDTEDSSNGSDLESDDKINYFFDNSKSQVFNTSRSSLTHDSDDNDHYFNERLSHRNDELLEEMYRREIEQYNAAAANKKKTDNKKESNFYKICIAGVVSVLVVGTIVGFVMYIQADVDSSTTSFSDVQFKQSSSHNSHNRQTILHSAKNICGAAKCCSPCFENDPNAACPERNNEFCLQHKETCEEACHAWQEDNSLVSTTAFIGYSSLLQEVPRVCNEDAMAQDPQTNIECQKLCASRMCCFASDEDNNCSRDNEEECYMFESCAVLHEDMDDRMRDLFEICDKASIASNEGYGNCQKFCSRRACCFMPHGFGGCYLDNPKWCQEYAVCSNLLSVEPMS